ncbi:tRNA 2-selenouridine(34) synthase MnmH [Rhodobacter sp. NTK016B]|uniref:tRNA 2-selenouridine(34) synthase MnmH n=1 Tax=Rhodobacter sp. NTK016B TaxID=2759676 RepID=UPI001A9087BB|nr:tRNA 2-selenouridine(34) synthase MnmH [Rhodobacter sp. NTK016B]MBN8293199.1 tRNA 2-selenouridine(34) synthase MnmH [Rhodobacter sp. NTK016B]
MQRLTLNSIADILSLPYDEVIDTRSPGEYAEDHVPGAVNLPSLDNDERARVGTVYVQDSRFKARRMGAALVAKNAATHLQTYLADKPADYRPLVYCWRGGMRSNAIALIYSQIGWRVGVLDGGWRSWRRLVQQALYETPFPAPVVMLDGNTGTAKTALLHKVKAMGAQVLDLEGLARHRGSLFGLTVGDSQPAQKGFESALAVEMAKLDPARPVLVEAESNRIGEIRIPPALWSAMQAAPRVEIAAPLAARADWLTRAYADVTADPGELAARIAALQPYQSRETIEAWQKLAVERQFPRLAAALMEAHYDPRYARTRLRRGTEPLRVYATETLDDAAQDRLAKRIAADLEGDFFNT